jgi:hypothetical protein
MNYTPPGMPLHVSWEGTDAYTPPALPLDVTWAEQAIEFQWVALLTTVPAPVPPMTMDAGVDYFVPLIAGQITDAVGHPAGRRVRIFERSSNTFEGETTSDPITGEYSFQVSGYGEYQRIVLAEDESDPLLNDLIDRIKVEWPET